LIDDTQIDLLDVE
jgi:hypothetical protein